MKKIVAFACALLACLCLLTGCAKPTQPGTFGEERFIWVDSVKDVFGNRLDIVADRITGVMYFKGTKGSYGQMCPIYNSDGSLVLYDPIG